jgi:hypothetical protein
MELRMQAVDQLLEAMAPSLSAELDRVLQQVRQQLENEFQARLQSALGAAEIETLHLAEVRLEEAVIEAREATRVQLTDSFNEQLQFALQQTRDAMKAKSDDDMQSAFANWAAERAQLQEQLSQWHVYAEAQQQLSECASQSEILARFLKLSEPFAESFAVYIAKPDGLALWKARGSGAFPPLISPGTSDPEHYFKAAVVRQKMVAAVSAVQPCKVESLDFLVSCLERAIESFGLKLHARNPQPPAPHAAANTNGTTADV